MRFFYDLILKIKNSYIFFIVVILFILINDIVLFKFDFLKFDKDLGDSEVNNVISLNEDSNSDYENEQIHIDIKGYVKKPGVYLIDNTLTINDAIKKAGGLKKGADTSNINLSKKVFNEMVIIVPKKLKTNDSKETETTNALNMPSETVSESSEFQDIVNDAEINAKDTNYFINSSDTKTKDNNNLININTALLEELVTLPGIGDAKAKTIISYRDVNKFEKIEDLLNVSGIGSSLYDKVKDHITV